MKNGIPYAALLSCLFLTAAQNADPDKQQRAKLEGTWNVVKVEKNRMIRQDESPLPLGFVIGLDKITITFGKETNYSYKLGLDKSPKTIDLIALDGPKRGKTFEGIFAIHDDILLMCIDYGVESKRPAKFTNKLEGEQTLEILRREKK